MKESDKKLIKETVELMLRQITIIGIAQYKADEAAEFYFFAKNCMLNMLGNFIFDYTDKSVEKALEMHASDVTKDVREMFDKLLSIVEKEKKESH